MGEGKKSPRAPLATRVAGASVRSPKRALIVSGVALLVAAPLGMTAFDSLDPYEFQDPGYRQRQGQRGARGGHGRARRRHRDRPRRRPARTDAGHQRVEEVGAELAEVEGIESVLTPWGPPQPTWIANDGQSAFVLGFVDADADSADVAPAAEEAFEEADDVQLGGVVIADEQISVQAEEDLRRAEILAFPLLLLLSLLFFRSLVAAALPLVLGGVAIVASLALMRLMHEAVPLTVLSINVVTGLGLGLAIDYSLFVLSRYREELARGLDTSAALMRTLSTAGRAVTFSAITVACAMASLLVFPQQFLYSVAIGGIAVTLFCALAALVVLPAVLALLGDRINALSPSWLQRSAKAADTPDEQGRWYRWSHWVMRHPGSVAIASAAILIVLALPALGVRFIPDDASLLPDDKSAGAVDRAARERLHPGPAVPDHHPVGLGRPRRPASALGHQVPR